MTSKNIDQNDYLTSHDLPLVAYISMWYPIEAIDKTLSRAEFVFKRDINLDKLVQSFWKREIQVEPLAYFNQIKVIKSRLYE